MKQSPKKQPLRERIFGLNDAVNDENFEMKKSAPMNRFESCRFHLSCLSEWKPVTCKKSCVLLIKFELGSLPCIRYPSWQSGYFRLGMKTQEKQKTPKRNSYFAALNEQHGFVYKTPRASKKSGSSKTLTSGTQLPCWIVHAICHYIWNCSVGRRAAHMQNIVNTH